MAGAVTKGIGFTNVRNFVKEKWGDEGWEAVLQRLRPDDRDVLASVVPIGWYSLALYAQLIRAVDEVHGYGDLSVLVQLGRYEAEKDLTTIHRMLLRLVNPATVVEKSMDYWRRFHDTGTWNIRRVSPTEVEGLLEGWGVVDHALCRELGGYLARLLELVGARSVVVEHPRCRANGDADCFFSARWAGS
jgi:predicted hydrocarbon binding protein